MPQPLLRAQPTSSVAAMLDHGVGAQVTAKTQPASASAKRSETAPDHSKSLPSTVAVVPRQFLLSAKSDGVLKRLQHVFAENTGLELRQSELLRAMLLAVEQLMPEIESESATVGPLRRPKNGLGSDSAQSMLERRIGEVVLVAARRSSKPYG